MSIKPDEFMNWRWLPGRLTAEQAALLLGCQPHDLPVLTQKGHVQPLGKPRQSSTRYYARVDILAKADDPTWNNKATLCLQRHWKEKRANRRPPSSPSEESGPE